MEWKLDADKVLIRGNALHMAEIGYGTGWRCSKGEDERLLPKNNSSGRKWWALFKKCHLEISLNPRTRCCTPEAIGYM